MKLAYTPSRLLPLLTMIACAASGCSSGSTGSVVTPPVTRATAIVVRDSAGSVVAGVQVIALDLDTDVATIAQTDAAGSVHLTLTAGRWATSTKRASSGAPTEVAASVGRVPGNSPGVSDTVLFELRLARESVATGVTRLAGRNDFGGTTVSVAELPTFATTTVSGAWRLNGLPPGIWTGLAEQLGFKTAAFDIVVPASGITVALPDTVVLQPGGTPAPRR